MIVKLRIFVFAAFLVSAFTLLADQAAYISKDEAMAAHALLQKSTTIKSFCAPCGDHNSVLIPVKTIDVTYTNYQNYWEVQINGKGIDLAYTYFLSNNKWRNVAIAMGLPVSGVPEFIE